MSLGDQNSGIPFLRIPVDEFQMVSVSQEIHFAVANSLSGNFACQVSCFFEGIMRFLARESLDLIVIHKTSIFGTFIDDPFSLKPESPCAAFQLGLPFSTAYLLHS